MRTMKNNLVVAGGGIGGLSAALACARRGWQVDLLEQGEVFCEFGAGIQLSPNVVRVLQRWGVGDALASVVAYPHQLDVRNARSGALLAVLPLGKTILQRYGAPYVTVARADLQDLLLAAVRRMPEVRLHLESRVISCVQDANQVRAQTVLDQEFAASALVAADGVWSKLRTYVIAQDTVPRVTGHLAFRAMLRQSALPPALRTDVVTAWMGPDFHVVQYPVRSGDWMNVVAIVQGKVQGDPKVWDHSANAAELRTRLAGAAAPLQALVQAIDQWRLWPLSDRPPMQSAAQHAKGRIALLGDAAHPMRPYLAQGAGMAIEDADVLAQCLEEGAADVPDALQRYAHRRWQRNARVQSRAIRNGEIFHMRGLMALARDLSLRTLGARLLDVPWLYTDQ